MMERSGILRMLSIVCVAWLLSTGLLGVLMRDEAAATLIGKCRRPTAIYISHQEFAPNLSKCQAVQERLKSEVETTVKRAGIEVLHEESPTAPVLMLRINGWLSEGSGAFLVDLRLREWVEGTRQGEKCPIRAVTWSNYPQIMRIGPGDCGEIEKHANLDVERFLRSL